MVTDRGVVLRFHSTPDWQANDVSLGGSTKSSLLYDGVGGLAMVRSSSKSVSAGASCVNCNISISKSGLRKSNSTSSVGSDSAGRSAELDSVLPDVAEIP